MRRLCWSKGFFTPELNKAATKDLAGEIAEYGATLGVSSSSTCEIGLGESGGIPFVGVAFLLDRCSKAKNKIYNITYHITKRTSCGSSFFVYSFGIIVMVIKKLCASI